MDDEQLPEGGFKVVDRRRFTESGEVREPDSEEAIERAREEAARKTAAASAERQRQPEPPRAREADDPRRQERSGAPQGDSVDFSGFVVSLATQTLMLLGEIPNPESNLLSANFDAARQTIDILALLEEKTRGNLTAEEAQLLGEVLSSLRMAFVKKTRAAG